MQKIKKVGIKWKEVAMNFVKDCHWHQVVQNFARDCQQTKMIRKTS